MRALVALLAATHAAAQSCGLLSVGCGSGLARDAAWPAPRHDSSSTGWSPLTGPAAIGTPALKWMLWQDVPSNYGCEIGPITAGAGRLFVIIGSNLTALNVTTGAELWHRTMDSLCGGPMPLQLDDNGILHFPVCQDRIYTIDAVTGAINASVYMYTTIWGTPALLNTSVSLYGTSDAPSGPTTPLFEIDSVKLSYLGFCKLPNLFASQVLVGNSSEVVIVVADRHGFESPAAAMFAVNVTNCSVVWTTPLFNGTFVFTPAILSTDGGVIIACQQQSASFLVAFNASDGSLLWNTSAVCGTFPMAVSPQGFVVLVATDVAAFNVSDGSTLWSKQLQTMIEVAPIIDAAGTVFVVDFYMNLYALDGLTGAIAWQMQLPNVSSSATSFDVMGFAIGEEGALHLSLLNDDTIPTQSWAVMSIIADAPSAAAVHARL